MHGSQGDGSLFTINTNPNNAQKYYYFGERNNQSLVPTKTHCN